MSKRANIGESCGANFAVSFDNVILRIPSNPLALTRTLVEFL